MNSEKSQDTEPFKVLIVGEPSRGTLKMLDHLTEKYGDRLEVIRDEGKIGGKDISFIVMDEYSDSIPPIGNQPVYTRQGWPKRDYYRVGRWE